VIELINPSSLKNLYHTPMLFIFLLICDSDSQDPSCILPFFPQSPLKLQGIPEVLDLPDRFFGRMICLQFQMQNSWSGVLLFK
jgi:hypothetical protein